MPREQFDPYAILGLAPTATFDEVTRAYRRHVRQLHPDTRNTPRSGLPADEQLRRVLAAYEVLRDPDRKADYDRSATRYERAAQRRPTASRAKAEATITAELSDVAVRILGTTIRFGVRRLS